MTLIFALLRENHIIFGSDRRHVLGDADGRYRNDDCWKTAPILNGTAMLGFAGPDLVEQIITPLLRAGTLEYGNLRTVADSISQCARDKYAKYSTNWAPVPNIQFLLAGFMQEGDGSSAMASVIEFPSLCSMETPYSSDSRRNNYGIIGKRNHGALYAFRKCAAGMTSIDAGLRLACFTLMEVGKYDTSVGGRPQICVIRPNQKVEDLSDNLQDEIRWAEGVGDQIRTLIVSPKKN